MIEIVLLCLISVGIAAIPLYMNHQDRKKWEVYGKGLVVSCDETFRNYYGTLQKFYHYEIEIEYKNMTIRQSAGSHNLYPVGSKVDYYMEGASFKINDGADVPVTAAVEHRTPAKTSYAGKLIMLPMIIGVLLLFLTIFDSTILVPLIVPTIFMLLIYFLLVARKNEKVQQINVQSDVDNGSVYPINANVIDIRRSQSRSALGRGYYSVYYAIILYKDVDGHNRLGEIRMERKNTYMINSTIQVYYHKLTHTISL
jgi:hypothetical protein